MEESNRLMLSGGGVKYSLEEQCIGTWINGKPLYQKTYDIRQSDIVKVGTSEQFDIPLNDVDVAVQIYNIALLKGGDGTEDWWCVNDASSNYLSFVENKERNVIRTVTTGRKLSQIIRMILTVQYTKKSDL